MIPSQKPETVWRPQPFFSHVMHNARDLEGLNGHGGLAIEFRKFRNGRLEIAGGQNKRLSLWRTLSTDGFLTVPKFEADLISVRFVIQGRFLRRSTREEQTARAGYAILNNFGQMRDDQASGGFESISGTIARDVLEAGHRALEGRASVSDLHFQPIVEVSSLPMRALMQTFVTLHRRLQRGVEGFDLVFPLIEEILVYQLLSAWPRLEGSARTAPVATSRRVRLAMDYIDAHLVDRITLAEIALAAGVGVRALQLSFQRELGTSPMAYILDRRLDRARADLLQAGPDVSVKVIAGRWGFAHMSDFGRRFRLRFGCSPGQLREGAATSKP